jgi:hypothetical protein
MPNLPPLAVRPTVQGAGEELMTETSKTPLPIRQELALELSAAVARWGGDYVVIDGLGRQTATWAIERAVRSARSKIEGLPEGSGSTTSGTAARRRRSTPTGTCGQTATSPHGPP